MPDIDFQKIKLNLIPKREDDPVVFYASQYETTRPFIADLFWGETEFAPGDDCWAEIDIRKNDDNLVVITDDVSIDNNEVSVILPVQAVTCIGKNLGQIKIYAGEDQFVAAFNFILEVQADPLAGGVTSETAIDNLESQIEDIATEVIGDDYYNKTETDALLANKADISDIPDMSNYYTKTQTDNLLNDKADVSDLATLASKAELTQAINDEDTTLKNWAYTQFATPGYVASNYYTKLQVDGIIDNMLPVGSASGNPCTFDTEIAAALSALTANIVCGGGGGTPSVPVPLVPYTEINLDVNGDTFTVAFGQTVYGGVYDKSGRLTITHGYVDLGELAYSLLSNTSTRQAWSTSGLVGLIKPPASGNDTYNAISSGFTAVSYNATWLPATFSSLTATGDQVVFCVEPNAYVDANAMKTAMSGIMFAYELVTPIVIDVPSISVFAENGVNNITSDCIGDVSVSYKDTIQHYIDTRL